MIGVPPLAAFAGLQLLGSADAEACVDGVCAVPEAALPTPDTTTEDVAS